MTSADRLIDRWTHDLHDCPGISEWAKEEDAKCRVEGFLHTERKRLVFSDGSVAIFAAGCLTREDGR